MNEGRNAGLTGLIDLPGQALNKFAIWVRAHTQQLGVEMLPDAGRGDTEWPGFIPGNSSGGLTVGGSISLDAYPTPDRFRGEAGTVTVQIHDGVTIAYPVVVEGASFFKKDKELGLQDVVMVCRVTGAPTFTGFTGIQPTAAVQSYADKQLWANLGKTHDPQGLASGESQRWRWFGTGDGDSAENTKIAAFAAALVAPASGLKLRPSTMTRASTSVCYFDTTWGLTDTAEDVVNPITATTLDANNLASQATAAAINATPSTPGGDSFVVRDTTTRELNDAKTLTSRTYGLRSTAADIEMPGTVKKLDVSSQEDADTVTITNGSSMPPATPSAPSGLLVATESEQLNAVPKWRHTFYFANTTPEQRILFGDSVADVDAGGLADSESVAVTTATSSPPGSPPSTPSGLVLRRRRAVRLTGTPEKWEHTYYFARTTTKDDVENDNSSARLDVSDLDELGEICQVTASAAPPSIPSTPVVGCQHVGTSTKKLHATAWRHTFRYEKDTNAQKEVNRRAYAAVDPSGLKSQSAAATVDGTPSTPAGLVLRETRTENLTNDHTISTKLAGERTTADDETFPRTKYQTDDGAIDQDTYVAVTFTTGGSPSAPSTPSGMVLVDYVDMPLTNASASNLSLRLYHFAFVNSATRVINGRTSRTVDPNVLESEQVKADIWDTGGAEPAVPSTPSGLKLNRKLYVPIPSHATKQVRVFEYAVLDSADRVNYATIKSTGRAWDGLRHTTSSLLASASSAATICAAQYAALKSNSDFDFVEVVKRSDGVAQVIVGTREAKTIIHFRAVMNGRRLVPAYYDGSDVFVYLRRKWQRSSGKWLMELVPNYRPGAVMAIRITQFVETDTGLPMNWDLGGTSNDADFLGLPAGTVTYVGAQGTVQWTDLPPAEFGAELEADSMGIIDLADYSVGLLETTTDLTSVTEKSWVKASDLGLACALATPADYSGLI